MRKILALDPTLSNIGAALFDDEGNLLGLSCLRPSNKHADQTERTLSLARQIGNLIRKHEVTDMVAEVTQGYIKSNKAAQSIYKAEGMVKGIAGSHKLKYHSVTIYDVKEAATGKKTGADKHAMIAAALKLNPVPPLSCRKNGKILIGKAEHEADAIFVGIAYFRLRKIREKLNILI
jgi:Holliday junction resolvasome RuvABC endonuclease subunit